MTLTIREEVRPIPMNHGDGGSELQHSLLTERPAPARLGGVVLDVYEEDHPPSGRED